MMTYKFSLVALSVLLLAIPAAGGVVLFDNFPINGTITGWTLNYGYALSDSFTLSSGATVGGVNIGVWRFPGDTVIGVDWAITSAPLGAGTSYGSGTAAVTTAAAGPPDYLGPNPNGDAFDIDVASFSFSGISLAAGTYYLTLQNAVSSLSNPVYWDENDGPGIDVWHNTIGHMSDNTANCYAGGTGTCADAFQILGEGSNIPEPTTWVLLGSGMLAIAGLRRKLFRL